MAIRLSKTANERVLMERPFVEVGRVLSNGRTKVDLRIATPEQLIELGPQWYEEVPDPEVHLQEVPKSKKKGDIAED